MCSVLSPPLGSGLEMTLRSTTQSSGDREGRKDSRVWYGVGMRHCRLLGLKGEEAWAGQPCFLRVMATPEGLGPSTLLCNKMRNASCFPACSEQFQVTGEMIPLSFSQPCAAGRGLSGKAPNQRRNESSRTCVPRSVLLPARASRGLRFWTAFHIQFLP